MSLFEEFLVSITPWSRGQLFEAAETLREYVRASGGNESDLKNVYKDFSSLLHRFADDKSCISIERLAKFFVNQRNQHDVKPQAAPHD
jgi:hypothetical protein